MKIYLDSVIAIYLVEQPASFGATARASIRKLSSTALAVSWLTRMECLVMPRRQRDASTGADFERFFLRKCLPLFGFDDAVFDRATDFRAKYRRLKTPDALHLAAAIESGCDCFVTNDGQLAIVTEIRVEVI